MTAGRSFRSSVAATVATVRDDPCILRPTHIGLRPSAGIGGEVGKLTGLNAAAIKCMPPGLDDGCGPGIESESRQCPVRNHPVDRDLANPEIAGCNQYPDPLVVLRHGAKSSESPADAGERQPAKDARRGTIQAGGTGRFFAPDLTACPSCSNASAPRATIDFRLTSPTDGTEGCGYRAVGVIPAESNPANAIARRAGPVGTSFAASVIGKGLSLSFLPGPDQRRRCSQPRAISDPIDAFGRTRPRRRMDQPTACSNREGLRRGPASPGGARLGRLRHPS